MKWLKSLFQSKRKEPQLYDIGGVESNLDQRSIQERLDCIQRMVDSGKSPEEATKLADSWYIMTVNSSIGGEPMRVRYIPCPVWDWDWAWRSMFDTYEEAEAYIESKRRVEEIDEDQA